jgi:hypothetical protein
MISVTPNIRGAFETSAALKAIELGVSTERVRMLRKAGVVLQKHLRLHSAGKTVGQGRGVHTKRGDLARRWLVEDVRGLGEYASTRVTNNHPGAAILEFGDTIRPKRARFLTVPIHPFADRKTAGDFPNAVLIKARSGLFLILPTATRSTILFKLVKSVRIPAYRYITNAINDARPEVAQVTDDSVTLAVRKGAN